MDRAGWHPNTNEKMQTELTTYNGTAVERADDGPTGLVRLAIEKGVDVAVLERLVALQEKVADRNAQSALVEALARFQAECPPLKRGKVVDYTTKSGVRVFYRFAALDEIAETIRPVLARNGLSYSWDSAALDGVLEVSCRLWHIDGASRSASFRCAIEGAGSPTMNGPQKAGSATSYGQRYSLVQVLGLTTADEDKDGGRGGDSAETITERQEADLNVLIDEVNANREKFLEYMKVKTLADIRASDMRRAIRLLESKRK